MVITKRDLELFKKLSNYGMLSTKQVADTVFNSVALATILRRLRALEKDFFIKRIVGLESYELLWVLTTKGADIANVVVPKRHWSKNMLEHDYKLVSLRLALERSGIAHSWIPEHEIRSMIFKKYGLRNAKEKVIPDGLMGIKVNGKMESVAIELELHFKNEKRYKETIRRYQSMHDTYAVWFISPKKSILNQVYRLWMNSREHFAPIKLQVSFLEEVLLNPSKARLMGKECAHIEDVWKCKGAHPSAQRVSGENEKKSDVEESLRAENHTQILAPAA